MKYFIKKEKVGTTWYYHIYKRGFFRDVFLERWLTLEDSAKRIIELNNSMNYQDEENYEKEHVAAAYSCFTWAVIFALLFGAMLAGLLKLIF